MKNIKSMNKWAIIMAVLFFGYSCENDSSEDFSNMDLSSLIIGTWQVYDIQVTGNEEKRIEYLERFSVSVECDSKTKYIFSNNGSLEVLNRMTYREVYNQENEQIGHECVPNSEGGGFKSGSWKIAMDSNGEEYLDLDWIYNNGDNNTDGVWWYPEFINEKTFRLGGYSEYFEIYHYIYYRRTDR